MWKMSLQIILLFAITFCYDYVVPVNVLLKFCHVRNMDSTIKKKKRNIERKIEMHYCLCRNTLLNSPWSFQVNLNFLLGIHNLIFPTESVFSVPEEGALLGDMLHENICCAQRGDTTLLFYFITDSLLSGKQTYLLKSGTESLPPGCVGSLPFISSIHGCDQRFSTISAISWWDH